MIDVEVSLFDELARLILAEFPEADVSSEYVVAPPSFPAVSIVETDNVEEESREDSSGVENAAAITYTVNVYSNSKTRAKQQCKEIVQLISKRMRVWNMTRTMCSTIDNAADPSIYRMVARFTGLIDKNEVMYRR